MNEFLRLPIDASVHGSEIDYMIVLVHWLMFVLFIGWGGFFLYTLVRFRAKKNPKADYKGVQGHMSTYLEAGVVLFEVILLVGFSIPFWASTVVNVPDEKDSVVLRVVGEQFAWNIHYPGADGKFGKTDPTEISQANPLGLVRSDQDAKDDIVSVNQMYVPVDKPVVIHLSSKDVIHSLSLPLLRVKQDAIPGMTIPVWFKANKTSVQVREMLTKRYPIKTRTKALEPNIQLTVLAEELGPLARGVTLYEEVVTQLQEEGKTVARVYSGFDRILDIKHPHLAMEDHKSEDGTVVVAKGEKITGQLIAKLAEAGVEELVVAPETPVEIVCAQLCGLGHFRMRGFVNIVSQEEFDKWLQEQATAE